jgi:hypothetical protein
MLVFDIMVRFQSDFTCRRLHPLNNSLYLWSKIRLLHFFLTAMAEAVVHDADEPVQCYFASLLTVAYTWLYVVVTLPHGWTNTDTPSMIVLMIAVYCGVNAAVLSNRDFMVLSFFFAIFSCALKLSAVPVLLIPLGLAIALVIRGQAATIPLGRIVLVFGLFAPWLLRNVMVSGCLAYPAAASCLPVPWAAVGEAVENTSLVRSYALNFWVRHAFSMLITWPAFVALGIGVAITIRRRHRVLPTANGLFIILAVYAIAGTIFWLVMAPDPRFGFGQLAVLGTLPGLMLLLSPARVGAIRPLRWLPAGLLVVSLVTALGYSVMRWSVKAETLAGDIGALLHQGRDAIVVEEISLIGYQPVTVPEVEAVMDGDVRRSKFGAYVIFLPPD